MNSKRKPTPQQNVCPDPGLLAHQYLQTMLMRNCSERTVHSWRYVLKRFVTWCEERGIECMSEVTSDIIAAYRRSLFHYRIPRTGKPLAFTSQVHYLIPVRRWFVWMKVQGFRETDPARDIELPKCDEQLPVATLTADRVEYSTSPT